MRVKQIQFFGRKLTTARARHGLAGVLTVLAVLVANGAQAFPALNLTPGVPDISSPAQIDVTYTYNGGTGIGTLTAFGGASQLNVPPGQAIAGGVFNLNATLDVTNMMVVSGALTINGTSPGFADPLLTSATLNAFGAGANDPLELLFGNLGGSTAGIFGPSAGVILSNTGFTGSLTQNFGTGGSFGASANTVSPAVGVPEPGMLALMLMGGGALVYTRRKRKAGLTTTQ